ncbi:MAG: M1 family metallopeptidase [Solirubrobacterales bacterium]
MRGPRLILCLAGLAFVGLVGAGATSAKDADRDPFFPRSGSSAYDVSHYDVRLAYRPGNRWLNATATIEATARQRQRRFSLDLDGLTVTEVTVDGEPASFNRGRSKLKVEPDQRLRGGDEFTVAVHYRGRPGTITDPDGSEEGWYRTDDGALAVGEPVGTATWLPCNNSLTDKASFSFHLTVPRRLKGVANGRLVRVRAAGARRTFDWRESQPMAPYLALIDIGRGKLVRTTIGKLPAWTLVDPRLEQASRPALGSLAEVVRFESRIFGPYPFDALGSVVDVGGFSYALETQTRPVYAFIPDRTTVVHETAHQWFGNSVGLERWPNIWLNEGFATWTQWYYAERHGGPTARQVFRQLYRTPPTNTALWEPPSGHPGQPANIFAPSTYVRGAMAIEALRMKIGTRTLLKVLRNWTTEHRYGNADIDEFIGLAEDMSGRQLDRLFQRWLYQRGKP